MKRTVIAPGLVMLLAVVPTLGAFGVMPALAHDVKGKTLPHKNLEEALEHLEGHIRDLREAVKGGHKMSRSMERGLIFDIEHMEQMIADEMARAKKAKQ